MIYFTADTHLGHENILPYRPFSSIEEMDAEIIGGINAVVQPNDVLYVLGDFIWKPRFYGHYRQRIRCREIYVVCGNHDSFSLRQHVSSLNETLYRQLKGVRFHMTHYPMVEWRAMHYGSIHLYGHCHGRMENTLNEMFRGRKAMDVGVDNAFRLLGTMRPLAIGYILEQLGVADA